MTVQREKKENNKNWWEPYGAFFFDISWWLAIPVIGALIAGKFLDDRFGTKPWLTLVCIGVAFVLSHIGIIKKAKALLKKSDTPKEKNNVSSDNRRQ